MANTPADTPERVEALEHQTTALRLRLRNLEAAREAHDAQTARLQAALGAVAHEHRAAVIRLEVAEQVLRTLLTPREGLPADVLELVGRIDPQIVARLRSPAAYCCTACGEVFDLPYTPTVATPCPECGESAVRRRAIPA